MEDKVNMLELLLRPAFLVRDGHITAVNREAARHLITEGTSIQDMIVLGLEEYSAFSGGCLCLTLQIEGQRFAASVVPAENGHLFFLEQDAMDAKLQSMALVAQELRAPLTGLMTASEQLLPMEAVQEDAAARSYAAQMNRRMFQMLRMIGNMSDAVRFANKQSQPTEYVDIVALLDEIFQKTIPLAQQSQKELRYRGLDNHVFTLADSELLERAVYSMISNAMKFSPAGSVIEATLTRSGNMLRFSIEDPGCGIDTGIQGSLFSRYMRQPALEDPLQGLGLGLLIVRLAAAAHGGTVLIDQPHGKGTRVTLTTMIRQDSQSTVRSPKLHIDYAGERDHALVELADVLDSCVYEVHKIN